MKKYDYSDMKTLTAIEVVKTNPKIYWGTESLTCEVVNASISSQLKGNGCEDVRVKEFFGWNIISTDAGWLPSSRKGINELFDTAHWLADGGGNGFRFEYFLKIVASDVCVFEKNNLHKIKGIVDESLPLELKENFKGKTSVVYRL